MPTYNRRHRPQNLDRSSQPRRRSGSTREPKGPFSGAWGNGSVQDALGEQTGTIQDLPGLEIASSDAELESESCGDSQGASGSCTDSKQTESRTEGPQAGTGIQTVLNQYVDQILGGDLSGATSGLSEAAAEHRTQIGDDATTQAMGQLWQVADQLADAQTAIGTQNFDEAKTLASQAADQARSLLSQQQISPEKADRIIQAAGGWWTQADQATSASGGQEQDTGRGRYAVYSTGRTAQGVLSPELDRDGSWSSRDFLPHHSDRSNSGAARRVRNAQNQDVDAYDFTFEKVDAQGNGIANTAQGLPLITPCDVKVVDIQETFQGSGNYGKFILLEDVETGQRFEIHHLDAVGKFTKGQVLPGGTVFGNQGSSGNTRNAYPTHVDIVATPETVESFVRANQTGIFRTQTKKEGA